MELIRNTFVLIAPDCPTGVGVVPPARGTTPTVATLQYELLTIRPYRLSLEDLIFETHVRRLGLDPEAIEAQGPAIRAALFAKPHPCMRASPLPKRYGWGVHHDDRGRIALFAAESADYRRFASGGVAGVALVAAMRSKRAG